MVRQDLTRRGKYLLFWRQWPSNWEPSEFSLHGRSYSCVEQYMMAEKARLFGDSSTLAKIMRTRDPAEQKALGRAVQGYVESRWAAVRYDVVLAGTVEKYRQNEALRALLLATSDDEVFVEASPVDTVWGIGIGAKHPDAGNPAKWRGQNLLGKAVTEARGVIRRERP